MRPRPSPEACGRAQRKAPSGRGHPAADGALTSEE
ncbi:hypothetical protein SFR_4638 [Streptomyces sp. FR-008]|nr:hypothetical protein SFR_4638 [Streptomyces sp. FR-008]